MKKFCTIFIISFALITFLLNTYSCQEKLILTEPTTDQPDQEVNPIKPNANQFILSQKISGDSTKGSSFYKIIDAGDGGFFFTGIDNSNYLIGKLDQFGNIIWKRRTIYRVFDICLIPDHSGQISNTLVAVGAFDSNNDGLVDEAKIIVCNGINGSLINEETVSSVDRGIWLNTLSLFSHNVDSCEFIGFGGTRSSGIFYPWSLQFNIMSNGTISTKKDRVFTMLSWVVFSAAIKNTTASSPAYFVRGQGYLNDSTVTHMIVYGLSDSLTTVWSKDIIHQSGFQTQGFIGRGITIVGENIIVVGNTDIEKQSNPSSGYWNAGLVASITKQGHVNWVKAVAITEYSEVYDDCFHDGNSLWVIGDCSTFIKMQSKRIFGYGLLSKIDPTTGNMLSNMSFGNEYYLAGFNSVVVRNNRAYCVGYTNYRVSNGGYQSWFAEVDVSNPVPPLQMPKENEIFIKRKLTDYSKKISFEER